MELCLSFYSTTAQWMVQHVIGEDQATCDIPDEVSTHAFVHTYVCTYVHIVCVVCVQGRQNRKGCKGFGLCITWTKYNVWYFHLAGIVITSLTQAIGLHLLSEKFLDHVPVFGMVT